MPVLTFFGLKNIVRFSLKCLSWTGVYGLDFVGFKKNVPIKQVPVLNHVMSYTSLTLLPAFIELKLCLHFERRHIQYWSVATYYVTLNWTRKGMCMSSTMNERIMIAQDEKSILHLTCSWKNAVKNTNDLRLYVIVLQVHSTET